MSVLKSIGSFFALIVGGFVAIVVGSFMLRGTMRMWDRDKTEDEKNEDSNE